MDIPVDAKRRNDAINEVGRIESDKESITKALRSAIGNSLDGETIQAIQDMIEGMIEERKNAIERIDKERRSLLKKILEEQKRVIQGKAIGTMQEETTKSKTINNQGKAARLEEMTLEILPPRDQNAMTIINNYLNKIPEVLKVELNTLPDKSVFKLKLREPVNIIEKLRLLPQVSEAEEIFELGQKKIKIILSSVFI
jgi:hypothetical protein